MADKKLDNAQGPCVRLGTRRTAPLIDAASLAAPLIDSPLALERAEDEEYDCQELDQCPHAYNNSQPDWDPSDPPGLMVIAAFLNAADAQYIGAFLYPPSSANTADPAVFSGSAGRALLFLQRYEARGQAQDLATALEYAEGAVAKVGTVDAATCGFLWGRPVVGAIAAVVRSRAGDQAGAQSMVDALIGYFEKAPGDAECPYESVALSRNKAFFSAHASLFPLF
jgi:hypothetical protein